MPPWIDTKSLLEMTLSARAERPRPGNPLRWVRAPEPPDVAWSFRSIAAPVSSQKMASRTWVATVARLSKFRTLCIRQAVQTAPDYFQNASVVRGARMTHGNWNVLTQPVPQRSNCPERQRGSAGDRFWLTAAVQRSSVARIGACVWKGGWTVLRLAPPNSKPLSPKGAAVFSLSHTAAHSSHTFCAGINLRRCCDFAPRCAGGWELFTQRVRV
jgi:hypothetical protein